MGCTDSKEADGSTPEGMAKIKDLFKDMNDIKWSGVSEILKGEDDQEKRDLLAVMQQINVTETQLQLIGETAQKTLGDALTDITAEMCDPYKWKLGEHNLDGFFALTERLEDIKGDELLCRIKNSIVLFAEDAKTALTFLGDEATVLANRKGYLIGLLERETKLTRDIFCEHKDNKWDFDLDNLPLIKGLLGWDKDISKVQLAKICDDIPKNAKGKKTYQTFQDIVNLFAMSNAGLEETWQQDAKLEHGVFCEKKTFIGNKKFIDTLWGTPEGTTSSEERFNVLCEMLVGEKTFKEIAQMNKYSTLDLAKMHVRHTWQGYSKQSVANSAKEICKDGAEWNKEEDFEKFGLHTGSTADEFCGYLGEVIRMTTDDMEAALQQMGGVVTQVARKGAALLPV